MWTSNTLMKIDTRSIGASPNPSGPAISGGGGTSAIWVTSPSAGATIRSAPVGVIRTGSRKKAPTQMVRPSISHGSTGQPSSQKQRVTIAAINRNLRPSGWTEGQRHLMPQPGRFEDMVVEIGRASWRERGTQEV